MAQTVMVKKSHNEKLAQKGKGLALTAFGAKLKQEGGARNNQQLISTLCDYVGCLWQVRRHAYSNH